MDEQTFKSKIFQAEVMRNIEHRPDYWAGYCRGLQRAFHGLHRRGLVEPNVTTTLHVAGSAARNRSDWSAKSTPSAKRTRVITRAAAGSTASQVSSMRPSGVAAS